MSQIVGGNKKNTDLCHQWSKKVRAGRESSPNYSLLFSALMAAMFPPPFLMIV